MTEHRDIQQNTDGEALPTANPGDPSPYPFPDPQTMEQDGLPERPDLPLPNTAQEEDS